MRKVKLGKFKAAEHRASIMLAGLGQDLVRRRESLSLSQKAIAGQLDTEVGKIDMLERGAPLSAHDYCALALALDCRLELVEINDRGK